MPTETSQPLAWIDAELARLDELSLRRRLATRRGRQGAIIQLDGRELVNFGSNDYLGLAGDPRLAAAVNSGRHGRLGRRRSPLILGHGESHDRLERRLAEFEGTEAAPFSPAGSPPTWRRSRPWSSAATPSSQTS